jgi:hypothetical protein
MVSDRRDVGQYEPNPRREMPVDRLPNLATGRYSKAGGQLIVNKPPGFVTANCT